MIKHRSYIFPIVRNGKKGTRATLYQRIYLNGEQWQTSLGISIVPADFDKTTERVSGDSNADRYNHTIAESKRIIEDIFLRFELVEKRVPVMSEITAEYLMQMSSLGLIRGKRAVEDTNKMLLHEKIDEFIDDQRAVKGWAAATVKNFANLRETLIDYDEEPTLNNTDDTALQSILNYMQSELLYASTTLQKRASYFRWYLGWAHSKGYYKGTSHLTFRPKFPGGNFEQKNIIYLTADELHRLEEYDFPKTQGYLERTRDVFLFACYCGLRYSDVVALRPENIYDGRINLVTQKTSDRLIIDLNKRTSAILDKYRGFAEQTGRSLPVASNQKTNKYLHTVCELCGIKDPTTQIYFDKDGRKEICLPKYELITFHTARRTFITQALMLGIPTPVIMKFTGHHSLAMLKPYMAVVESLKKQEMSKFDNL